MTHHTELPCHMQTGHTEPLWIVLHGGAGAQRYRWGEWAKGVADTLVSSGQWIIYRDGNQVELKHRSMVLQ